jgi:hypothetical protein
MEKLLKKIIYLNIMDIKFKINCREIFNKLNYSRYNDFTHLIRINYIKDLDYITIPNKPSSRGGHNKVDYYITENCLKRIIINHSRCRNININYKDVKINNLEIKYIEREITKEQSTIGFIKKCFAYLDPMAQYYIYKNIKEHYHIDLYIEKYKLAIECDENNHKDRNPLKEKERMEFIINKIGCKFIRFNPDDTNFDITNVINTIIKEIKKSKI